MDAFRRIGFALWLAFALVAGQQLAALHALGHATERLSQKDDSKPAPAKCGECFACAQLSAGAAAATASVPVVECAFVAATRVERGAHVTPRLAYHSRAPPALL